MKYFSNIKRWGTAAVATVCLCASCDYLDVVPPEQPNLEDATTTEQRALGFLYSCYAGIPSTDPVWTNYLSEVISSTDETVLPYSWSSDGIWDEYAFNTATAMNQNWIWGATYKYIGQCLLFLQEIEKMNQNLVSAETMKIWKAEAKALIAYYHFCTLRRYGPIPITDSYIDMDAAQSEYRGRYHFDYCVDWIAKQLDEAAADLPARREKSDEWGRMTKVIVKSLKARLLLYAASPLWNGEFPYPQWKNTNFETPGYGDGLVSNSYDPQKWDRALAACQEALSLAEGDGGHALYDDENFYATKQLALPYVPGVSDGDMDEAEKEKFLKTVMKMRYVVATRSVDGNKEIIWGNWNHDLNGGGYARLPLRIIKYTGGQWWSGYSGVAPTLNTVEMFYTKDGRQPAHDPAYTAKAEWLKPSGIRHAFTNALGESRSLDIANLHVGREPRFYAWIAFDGGEFAPRFMDGKPLVLEMRNGSIHGYDPASFNRDYSSTGYLTQKFISPSIEFNSSGSGSWGDDAPSIQIRLAELYLNLAECYAAKGDVPNTLKYLNPIRRRAYVPELRAEDVTSEMPVMEWVRSERFIELWGEGHRFYDVRRWCLGTKYFGEGVRRGLNAAVQNPDYDTFYKSTVLSSPYVWSNRMYLNPVFYNEVYKNPQMVQAPEY